MVKKKTLTRIKTKKVTKKSSNQTVFGRFFNSVKRRGQTKLLLFTLVFGLVGCYMLYSSFALTAVAPYKGLWLSQSEILDLPTSGTAWTNLKTVADGSLGTPQISDQNNRHNMKTLAVAFVYARTGDDIYRVKARDAIMSAIGTECLPSSDGVRTLALGRNLAGYVFAADLINLPDMGYTTKANPCNNKTENFEQWLTHIRTDVMPDNGRWPTLIKTHENTSSNWGGFAGSSRIAASLYLGDTADVTEAAKIHRAYVDRAAYPTRSWGNYFQPTTEYDGANWACGDINTWLAINPSCTKNGYNIDGALVEDISREASNVTLLPQPSGSAGMSYSWEVLQGLMVQAEMLRRFGYENLWTMPGQPLKRAMDFMVRAGWRNDSTVSYHVPWLANYHYGAGTYPTVNALYGRTMGWSDWTHGGTVTSPTTDTTKPSQPSGLTATTQSTSQVNLAWSASTDNVAVTGYDIYRNGTKVTTVASNSFANTGLSAGTSYSYYVVARDAAGNSSSASNTVTTSTMAASAPTTSDTTAPKVVIKSPAMDSTVRNTVTISATATDNTRITKTEVYIDGALKNSFTSGTISTKWNSKNASKGAHTITVKAYDAAGNTAQSTVTVYK